MVRNRTWMLLGMVVVAGLGTARGSPEEECYVAKAGWCPGPGLLGPSIQNEHHQWHMIEMGVGFPLPGLEFVEFHREFLAQSDDHRLFDVCIPAGGPEDAIVPVIAQTPSLLKFTNNNLPTSGYLRPAGHDITTADGRQTAWDPRPANLRLRNTFFHGYSGNGVGVAMNSIWHGNGHTSIARHDRVSAANPLSARGDMGDTFNATRDGAFFQWHKNIDNVYADWAVGKFQLLANTGTPVFFSVNSTAAGAAGSSLNRRSLSLVYQGNNPPLADQYGASPRIASDIYVGDDTDVDPTAVVTRNLLYAAGTRRWNTLDAWDVDAWTILNPPGNGWYFSLAASGSVLESAGAGANSVYRTAAALGLAAGDNLDALEVDQQKRVQATNDYARQGIAHRPRQWFSLRTGTTHLVEAGSGVAVGPSDILRFDVNGTLVIEVPAASLGLGGAELDALVITDEDASDTLSLNDRIYYSTATAGSAADIFCRLYDPALPVPLTACAGVLAPALGLLAGDDLDALDVRLAATNAGACCNVGGGCTNGVLAAACPAPNTFWGPGTVCSAAECPSAPGGCCHRNGTCTQISDSACLAAGGSFRGAGVPCPVCVGGTTPGAACTSNANCPGGGTCPNPCPQAPPNDDCYGAYQIPYDYPSQYQPGYDYYEPPPQYTDNTYAYTTDEYYPAVPPVGYNPPPPPTDQYYDPPYSCRDHETFFPPYGSGTIWYSYDVPSQPVAGPGPRPIGLYTSKTYDNYSEGGYAGDTTIAVYYAPNYNPGGGEPYGCYGLQEVACGDNHYEQYSPENQGYGQYGYAEYYPQQPGRYYIQVSTVGDAQRGRMTLRVSNPQLSTGACCIPDTGPPNNGCLLGVTEDSCIKAPGRYMGDGTTSCPPHDAEGNCIPTVSEWGLVVMAVLVLTAATVVLMRRRAAVA